MAHRSSAPLSPVVPSISFSTENVEVGEEDGSAEICLDLSVPLSTDLQVVVSASAGTGTFHFTFMSIFSQCDNPIVSNTADSGSDFLAGTQTASFTAGSTRACVNFVIIDDDLALEGDETFTATFETPDGFASVDPSTATVTIIDNDGTSYRRQSVAFCTYALYHSSVHGPVHRGRLQLCRGRSQCSCVSGRYWTDSSASHCHRLISRPRNSNRS